MDLIRYCVAIFFVCGLQNIHASERTSISAGLRYLAKLLPANQMGVSITNVGPCQVSVEESLASQKYQLHIQDMQKTLIVGGSQEFESIIVHGKPYTSFVQIDSLNSHRVGFKMTFQQVLKRSDLFCVGQDLVLVLAIELERRSFVEPMAIASISGDLWSHRNFIFEEDDLHKEEMGSIRCLAR